jgi:hypothetical protein
MHERGASKSAIAEGIRPDRPIPQPGYRSYATMPDSRDEDAVGRAGGNLERLHDNSLIDFLHPKGFGYVHDRSHVAGFQAHGFSKVPADPNELWLESVELIGLMREKPVAYVSDNLPRMEELRHAAVRPLDPFEQAALDAFARGEDMHVAEEGPTVRMVGPIRLTRQCLDCHRGRRGDLIGGLSYSLRAARRNVPE